MTLIVVGIKIVLGQWGDQYAVRGNVGVSRSCPGLENHPVLQPKVNLIIQAPAPFVLLPLEHLGTSGGHHQPGY